MDEYLVTEQPDRRPTHPGELIRGVIEDHFGMSISEAARRIGISRQRLHAILAGSAPVTPETAVRIGKLFNASPRLWLDMQTAYDVWVVSSSLADVLAKIEPAPIAPPL